MFRIQENIVETSENLIFGFPPERTTFYSIGSKHREMQNFEVSGKQYITIYFLLSQEYNLYQRSVFTFFDMFGQLGGVYQLLWILGAILVSCTAKKVFYNSILSRLYHVHEELVNSETKIKPYISKTINTSEILKIGNLWMLPPLNSPERRDLQEENKVLSGNSYSSESELQRYSKVEQFDNILEHVSCSMKSRRKYNYRFSHILCSLFLCWKVKNPRSKSLQGYYTYAQLYK